jgi:hypothetical protein
MHADHEPMISQPDTFADLLVHLAEVRQSDDIRGMTRSVTAQPSMRATSPGRTGGEVVVVESDEEGSCP